MPLLLWSRRAVSISAGDQSVTISAPAATLVAAISLTAGLASVEIRAPTATLTPTGISLPANHNTAQVTAPEVTLDTSVATLSAGAAVVTLSAPAATVSGDTSLLAGAASITVSGPAVTIDTFTTVNAGDVVVSVHAPAATLLGDTPVTAGAPSITVTAPDATLVSSGGVGELAAGLAQVNLIAPGAQVVPGAISLPVTETVIAITAPAADVSLVLDAGGNVVLISAPDASIEQGLPPLEPDPVGPPPLYYPAFRQEEAAYVGVAAMRVGFEDRVNRGQVTATAARVTLAPRGIARTERVTVPVVALTAAPDSVVRQERVLPPLVAKVHVVPSGLLSREASPDATAPTLRAVNESRAVSGSRRAVLLADDDDLLLITEVL